MRSRPPTRPVPMSARSPCSSRPARSSAWWSRIWRALRAAGTGRIEDALRVSLAECSRGLPPYKRISGYAVGREPLPRTRLGKYRRHLLSELYARAQTGAAVPAAPPSEADATLLAKPRAAQVWQWLERRYPDRPLSLETSPQLDLGIDSLAWLEIGLAFERAFGFRLSEEAAARVLILRDLLQEVEAAPAAAASGAAELSPDDARWLVPAGTLLSALGFVARTLVWAVMRAGFRLRVGWGRAFAAHGSRRTGLQPFERSRPLRGRRRPALEPYAPGPLGCGPDAPVRHAAAPRGRTHVQPVSRGRPGRPAKACLRPRGAGAGRHPHLVSRGNGDRPPASCRPSCRASVC